MTGGFFILAGFYSLQVAASNFTLLAVRAGAAMLSGGCFQSMQVRLAQILIPRRAGNLWSQHPVPELGGRVVGGTHQLNDAPVRTQGRSDGNPNQLIDLCLNLGALQREKLTTHCMNAQLAVFPSSGGTSPDWQLNDPVSDSAFHDFEA
jgi:hypothetical protein